MYWADKISKKGKNISFLFSLRQNKTFPESFNDNKLHVTYLDITIMEKHWAHCLTYCKKNLR